MNNVDDEILDFASHLEGGSASSLAAEEMRQAAEFSKEVRITLLNRHHQAKLNQGESIDVVEGESPLAQLNLKEGDSVMTEVIVESESGDEPKTIHLLDVENIWLEEQSKVLFNDFAEDWHTRETELTYQEVFRGNKELRAELLALVEQKGEKWRTAEELKTFVKNLDNKDLPLDDRGLPIASDKHVGTKAERQRSDAMNKTPNSHIHVHAGSNNTHVTLTFRGMVKLNKSCGTLGFKGAKRSLPYASEVLGEFVGKWLKDGQPANVNVPGVDFVAPEIHYAFRGSGAGKEGVLRGLASQGIPILSISDVTQTAHGGNRGRKQRRV